MEAQIYHSAYVDEQGNLKRFNREQFRRDLEPFAGKEVEILVRKKKKQRSLPQCAWYFAVIVPCIQQGLKETHGFRPTIEETHEWLKSKFNTKTLVNTETGEVTTFPQSTTGLSTTEFADYCDRCRVFALDFLNVSIPDPEKQVSLFSHV